MKCCSNSSGQLAFNMCDLSQRSSMHLGLWKQSPSPLLSALMTLETISVCCLLPWVEVSFTNACHSWVPCPCPCSLPSLLLYHNLCVACFAFPSHNLPFLSDVSALKTAVFIRMQFLLICIIRFLKGKFLHWKYKDCLKSPQTRRSLQVSNTRENERRASLCLLNCK